MKRWTHFLLVICMVLLLPMVSVAAKAADASGVCGDDLTWTFDEATGTLTIDGNGPMWDWGSYFDTPWISATIKSLVIHDGVTSIGDHAFHACINLTQVIIPDSVTSIGEYAFYGCFNLDDVTIPNSITSIGDWAFSCCTSLTKMAIPSSVTSIGSETFANCGLYTITIPDSVTSIGEYAFEGCSNLREVTIGNSVASIGSGAFGTCFRLYEVTIGDSVTSIGDRAFFGCSMSDVIIPNSVTYIGKQAFDDVFGLNNVYYLGTEAQWDAIDIENDNDSLLNATIHFAFDPETGAVSFPMRLIGADVALIAAYAEGKLIGAVTGQLGNKNYIPLAEQPDEIRIFYLYDNYQPVTAPDIIPLD